MPSEVVPLDQREAFAFRVPCGTIPPYGYEVAILSWEDWVKYAHELNLEIAKRIRK